MVRTVSVQSERMRQVMSTRAADLERRLAAGGGEAGILLVCGGPACDLAGALDGLWDGAYTEEDFRMMVWALPQSLRCLGSVITCGVWLTCWSPAGRARGGGVVGGGKGDKPTLGGAGGGRGCTLRGTHAGSDSIMEAQGGGGRHRHRRPKVLSTPPSRLCLFLLVISLPLSSSSIGRSVVCDPGVDAGWAERRWSNR